MDIERSRKILKWITIGVTLLSILIFAGFTLLFFTQPQIVPSNETFGSFWLKNFAMLIAALALASSALAGYYNSLEQRHLRYSENYPYLAVFPVLSVDPLPLPIPKADVPTELREFNVEYLQAVAPDNVLSTSDPDFRFLALALRNVGHGPIARISIEGKARVPNWKVAPTPFKIDRRLDIRPGDTLPFTILPIEGLPEYEVEIMKLEYWGHFVRLVEYDGPQLMKDSHPYTVPMERRDNIFFDDFTSLPIGIGWQLDFWGSWQPSENIHIPRPLGNSHYLLMQGDIEQFKEHYLSQGGAYKDLVNMLSYGQTVEVTARVRANPGTQATMQLWCHDLDPNPKSRFSDRITPAEEWQELSILYTATQTSNLRIHLLYHPGAGEILVDSVRVDILHT
ncbi:MAG: hypothetical protein KAV87_38520 [Desulfobacteraceae bacterium]|nr:hypothetical protein [Desulfobacteraceae bacterium]